MAARTVSIGTQFPADFSARPDIGEESLGRLSQPGSWRTTLLRPVRACTTQTHLDIEREILPAGRTVAFVAPGRSVSRYNERTRHVADREWSACPVAGASGINMHEAGITADAAQSRPSRSSGKTRKGQSRKGNVRCLRLKVQRVPCSAFPRAPQHVVGPLRPEPGMQNDLALVALLNREMPDACQDSQQSGVDGHRTALAPVAHEPFQAARLDRIQSAPGLEPGGQGFPGRRVTQPEERLRGGIRQIEGLRKRCRTGQDAGDGSQDHCPALGTGDGVAPTWKTGAVRPGLATRIGESRRDHPFRRRRNVRWNGRRTCFPCHHRISCAQAYCHAGRRRPCHGSLRAASVQAACPKTAASAMTMLTGSMVQFGRDLWIADAIVPLRFHDAKGLRLPRRASMTDSRRVFQPIWDASRGRHEMLPIQACGPLADFVTPRAAPSRFLRCPAMPSRLSAREHPL